jgi:26S proteasome regulatory subunit N2
LDVVEHSIKAGGPAVILPYVYDLTMTVVQDQAYRNTLLHLLVDQFRKLEEPDYVAINQCLVHLGDHQASAELLQNLVSSGTQVSVTSGLLHLTSFNNTHISRQIPIFLYFFLISS